MDIIYLSLARAKPGARWNGILAIGRPRIDRFYRIVNFFHAAPQEMVHRTGWPWPTASEYERGALIGYAWRRYRLRLSWSAASDTYLACPEGTELANTVGPDASFRVALAKNVVLVGMIGMFAVSAVAIWLVGDSSRADMVRLVFASIIPLLGTWVGTVLAFYFARDSLQAATDSTARLIGRLDPQTSVNQAMVPKAKMVTKAVDSEDEAKAVSLAELTNLMKSKNVHRIPLLDGTGAVLFVVHESTINAYAALRAASGDQTPSVPPTAKISDLLAEKELQRLIAAIAVVAATATVAEARTVMGAVDGCNDVFVTTSGRRKDPVLGWLTNTDLAALR